MLNTNYTQLSWWLVRFTGPLLIFGMFYDIEVLIFVYSLVITHLKAGLETILNDYVHDKLICSCFLSSARLLSLETISFLSDFLL